MSPNGEFLSQRHTGSSTPASQAGNFSPRGRMTPWRPTRHANRYIGVRDGYLRDFSYRTHADFYPESLRLRLRSTSGGWPQFREGPAAGRLFVLECFEDVEPRCTACWQNRSEDA